MKCLLRVKSARLGIVNYDIARQGLGRNSSELCVTGRALSNLIIAFTMICVCVCVFVCARACVCAIIQFEPSVLSRKVFVKGNRFDFFKHHIFFLYNCLRYILNN